ncbi:MAG: DNA-methyltransferase [Burkholderiaceae bacterium]
MLTPEWTDGQATFYLGDVRDVLRELPDESVHCVVTSPPYWGLRDYGTATWEGGDAECKHQQGRPGAGRADGVVDERAQRNRDGAGAMGGDCKRCGARRIDQQIGLEPTFAEFIERMVEVFREVRRVLRSDGVAWVNMGDSYASSGGHTDNGASSQRQGRANLSEQNRGSYSTIAQGTKPKDLLGQPWALAFALRDDGWWLRSEVIWHKPNPMPESVTDRPTKAHEQVFLLTKSARYYFDSDSIREPHARLWGENNGGSWAHTENQPPETKAGNHSGAYPLPNPAGRNARSVWTIATEPYPDAHFATFPTELPRRCILAGTSERGACAECGAPWARVVERGELVARTENDGKWYELPKAQAAAGTNVKGRSEGWLPNHQRTATTTGWSPTCAHEAPTVPCVVLDPFLGSGTTAWVAKTLGRHAVGIELNPEYLALSIRRNLQMGML